MIISAIVVVLLIVIVWKWGTIRDALQTKWFNKQTASAQAHGDTASTFQAAADTAHVQGVIIRDNWHVLTGSPEVRSSPVATKVAVAGSKVIAKADTEITDLRAANSQLKLQVSDLQSRGELPQPRAVPYADALYSFSNKRRPVIAGRVGLDYRLLKYVSAKVEVGYMPPPVETVSQVPEFILNVGGHITFR